MVYVYSNDFSKGTANLICLDLGKIQDLEVNSHLKNLKSLCMTNLLKCFFFFSFHYDFTGSSKNFCLQICSATHTDQVTFVALTKYLMKEGRYSLFWLRVWGYSPSSWEGMVAGVCGGWSHCTHSGREKWMLAPPCLLTLKCFSDSNPLDGVTHIEGHLSLQLILPRSTLLDPIRGWIPWWF